MIEIATLKSTLLKTMRRNQGTEKWTKKKSSKREDEQRLKKKKKKLATEIRFLQEFFSNPLRHFGTSPSVGSITSCHRHEPKYKKKMRKLLLWQTKSLTFIFAVYSHGWEKKKKKKGGVGRETNTRQEWTHVWLNLGTKDKKPTSEWLISITKW